MSRVAKSPVAIPAGVEVKINGQEVTVKGAKESMSWGVHEKVEVKQEENNIVFSGRDDAKDAWALAGTTRALVNNMVIGVSTGFQKKLELNGVGYRAKAAGKTLNLTLGFSHPVDYELPEGVTAETPSQTEIVLKGADKQLIGQVAAEIRAFRPPEPYKGKGIRYSDEYVRRKEAKKK
ncbi:MAG: 50S ribosomal protein L6 [Oceanicoccus sp.]|uniref:50S ribosomal protein L6 n=1 Tax=Oceanicoccus sp. TaxID=2691044 RepID=UPI00261BA7A7|nr:50S ribosomal protein L6 [Oceanicoccus sp.]MCP3909199.1 50S ribosomal protein L6 [Oceanicoccus sp.]MDG1772666.1 50S ribosomal protein L6 [Oceanicoccus sp.]